MNNATTFMGDIVKSFQEAGTAIGGVPITPSAIFWAGINIVSTIWNNMHGFLDAIAEIPVMIAAIPIIIAFSMAAVWMLMVLIEAYFRIGLAALFLAFGGMRWTRNIATSLVMSCVAVGFKLLAMELIVGIVGEYAIQWAQHAKGLSFQGIFVMIGASFVFAALVKVIPDSLERIVYGHIHSYTYHQATGMVRNEAQAGLALAAAPVAGMAGFGMLAWQLIKHAAESETRGAGQIEGSSRGGVMALAASTAAGSEIGGRLGGIYRGVVATLARMAGNIQQQRAVAQAESQRPAPPTGSSNG
jgi:P-type conjugative transfer protein TrbL